MPLTLENIQIVKATAPVIAEHALAITSLFYETMFKNNPEVLHYFNKAHQVGQAQPKALAHSIIAYASHIDHLDALGPLVKKITERHVALSIKPEHYLIVHKNLMIAIGEVLGDAVTPEIAHGWSEAIMALAELCIAAEETLYKEKEATKGGWRYEREFTVASKTIVAEDTVRFQFEPADGYSEGFDYAAGQYLTIRLPDLKLTAPRHYTLTSLPGSKTLDIVQRLVLGGVVSSHMHRTLKVGDTVLLGVPSGVFVPQSKDRDVVLVSAGVGETPMASLVQTLGSRVKAAYHVDKNQARHPCHDVFDQANLPFFETWYTESQGKPDCAKIATQLVKAANKDADYYICGPNSFMQAMERHLAKQNCTHVYTEVFGTGSVDSNKCPMH